MRNALEIAVFASLVSCQQAGTGVVPGAPDLVIRHINVVDVEAGGLLHDQLIAITDGRIVAVLPDQGNWDPSRETRVIDGTGRYALPGLWDMHAHVCWSDTNAALLMPELLAQGITGMRDMGGDLRLVSAFKQQVHKDPSLGPDIHACGPIIDGNPPVFPDFTVPVDSTSDIPRIIDSLVAHGAQFIKVYSLLQEAELERIAEHCRSRGIPFAGHLSEFADPERSIALGQRSVEHLNRLDELWTTDISRFDSLAGMMRTSGAWSCPTLVTYRRKVQAHDPAIRDSVRDRLVPGLQAEWMQWSQKRAARYGTLDQRDSVARHYQRQLALVKHLHDRGVRILAGSDLCGQAFIYPGIGLHEELELLVDAGLSTAEALRAATIGPATYFGEQTDRGSISVGKQADLVILSDDPLGSIRNTRSIQAVLHRGVLVGQD